MEKDVKADSARILSGGATPEGRFQSLLDMLDDAALRAPEGVFLRHPRNGQVTEIRYAEARDLALRLGRGLRAGGLSEERPLAILSGNSIDHALMMLGAASAGIPVAPISAAYSLAADKGRLMSVLEALQPGMVYAEGGDAFAGALELARGLGIAVITGSVMAPDQDSVAELLAAGDGTGSVARPGPETIARILFTSGSTGTPKGVVLTHRMFCSNQAALEQVWESLGDTTPVVVDWLPWSHVFGGGLVFNYVLSRAGTLVIDEGRPMPGQFAKTIANLAEARPTFHFGVPRGFAELVPALAADEDFARAYFSRLKGVFTAGAAITSDCWDGLRQLAARNGRDDLWIMIGWGATETSPVVTVTRLGESLPNALGAPIPGAEVKMVPAADTFELRLRGPMVTPGYWRRPDLTEAQFDEDGFYRIGDAGKLIDPAQPERGLLFDGRIAENFKLATGTWVSVGQVRVEMVAQAAPLVRDIVVAGSDRNEIGLLIFPNMEECRAIAALPDGTDEEVIRDPAVRDRIAAAMIAHSSGRSASARIRRALILTEQPSAEAGEITDKGYVNQGLVLRLRADAIETLYRDPPLAPVILAGHSN